MADVQSQEWSDTLPKAEMSYTSAQPLEVKSRTHQNETCDSQLFGSCLGVGLLAGSPEHRLDAELQRFLLLRNFGNGGLLLGTIDQIRISEVK